ncbi:MAG: PTS transporter subunit EIIC [Selenomonadaceae bacterium]|nr:PTS transporter subunit EIIC [Selenomonadaceae bacterium]
MNKKTQILEEIGQSFMLPVALMAVAGLLLGIGSAFTNEATIENYGLVKLLANDTAIYAVFSVLKAVGGCVFKNLSLIFAIGVAFAMAREEKGTAALSAVTSYFTMNITMNAILKLQGLILPDGSISADVMRGVIVSNCGVMSLATGVFGGVLVGLIVAWLHNRYCKIVLPNLLSFFGGTHFVPIVTMFFFIIVGAVLTVVWSYLDECIVYVGSFVTDTGYLGTFIFGVIKRVLIPLGLHHVFYMPFWQTAVGGSAMIDGHLIQGGQNIFLAQLASHTVTQVSSDATRYFSGEFIFIIFGLPGAALAMYHTARPSKKKAVGGLLLSAAFVSILTGTTQPIEFSFLFVAPLLFGVHVFLAGAAYALAHILDIGVGLTYSGGILDLLIFGVLPGDAKTHWMRVIPAGIAYFIVYYAVFRYLIIKYDFKTPGRESDEEITKLYTKADIEAQKNAKNYSER